MPIKNYLLAASLLGFGVAVLTLTDWGLPKQETQELSTISKTNQEFQAQKMEAQIQAMSSKINKMEKLQKEFIMRIENKVAARIGSLEDRLNVQLSKVDDNSVQHMTDESAVLSASEEDEESFEHTFMSTLDEQIVSGRKDAGWEKTLEENINHSIEKNLDVNTTLLDVNCDMSLCKVEVEQGSNATNEKMLFMAYLSQLDAFNDKETFYKTQVEGNGNEITTLYVAREGYRLPETPTQ